MSALMDSSHQEFCPRCKCTYACGCHIGKPTKGGLLCPLCYDQEISVLPKHPHSMHIAKEGAWEICRECHGTGKNFYVKEVRP
jgi:hypothetical protein